MHLLAHRSHWLRTFPGELNSCMHRTAEESVSALHGPKYPWAEGGRTSHACFRASVHIQPPSGRRARSDPRGPDIRVSVSCHGFLRVVANCSLQKERHGTGKLVRRSITKGWLWLIPTNGPGTLQGSCPSCMEPVTWYLCVLAPESEVLSGNCDQRTGDEGELTCDLVNTSQK